MKLFLLQIVSKNNMEQPSLCIPRVHVNISENQIRRIFNELKLGVIERVDMIVCKKNEKFKMVFIHFKKWFTEGNAQIAREKLKQGEEIKVIYDDPWFWKISAYRDVYKKPILEMTVNPVKRVFKHEPITPSSPREPTKKKRDITFPRQIEDEHFTNFIETDINNES